METLCTVCNGTGRDPMSDTVSRLPCKHCNNGKVDVFKHYPRVKRLIEDPELAHRMAALYLHWNPFIFGWSDYILPFYAALAEDLPNPCNVVEIGVAAGRSALFLAERLAEKGHTKSRIYCVDPWSPDYTVNYVDGTAIRAYDAISFERFIRNLNSMKSNARELIYPIRAFSFDAIHLLAKAHPAFSFDALYIDGDHEECGVFADLVDYVEVLIRPGGIVAGDDFGPNFPGVKAALDRFRPDGYSTIASQWCFIR